MFEPFSSIASSEYLELAGTMNLEQPRLINSFKSRNSDITNATTIRTITSFQSSMPPKELTMTNKGTKGGWYWVE